MEQSIPAIPSRLYGVECLSISAILSGLYRVEYFCCSKQVMQTRSFLLLRSSRQEVFCEKDLRSGTLTKRETLAHSCFPVNSVKLLRTSFLTKQFQWLLLCSLNQSEHFNDLKKVMQSRNFATMPRAYLENSPILSSTWNRNSTGVGAFTPPLSTCLSLFVLEHPTPHKLTFFWLELPLFPSISIYTCEIQRKEINNEYQYLWLNSTCLLRSHS